MSEVSLTADDLVIIGRGRILETTTVAAFVAEHSTHSIRVATPEPDNCTRCSKPRRRSPSARCPAMPTTRSKAGCSALKVPHWSRLRGRSRRCSTRPARYRGRCRPNTASLPQPTLSRTRRRCRDGAASYPAVASARAVARRGETGAPRPRGHAAGCRRVEDSIDRPAGVQEIRHQMTPIRPYRRALGHSRAIWPLPQGRRTPRNIVRM